MRISQQPTTLDTHLNVAFHHQVHFTQGALDPANPVLNQALVGQNLPPARLIAFIDGNLLSAHPKIPEQLRAYASQHPGFPTVELVASVTAGEAAKRTMAVVDTVVVAVEEHRIDRQSYVLAMGGGAVLDAVGFGAAIAHRGVRLVRMPTTTLSQDDAAMAVKNSVNLGRKKNFVGTFAVPHAVVCDELYLQSSPDWSWRGGFSEAVKIALLRDQGLFARIERDATALCDRSMDAARPIIARSAQLHYEHIVQGGDPFELKSARPLDYGHWLAHRLEGLSDGELPHGQAVAIGVAVDTMYSACAGLLASKDAERVLAVLRALQLPVTHPELGDLEGISAGIEEFREHLGGRLTITLLKDIGVPVDVHTVDLAMLREAISRCNS